MNHWKHLSTLQKRMYILLVCVMLNVISVYIMHKTINAQAKYINTLVEHRMELMKAMADKQNTIQVMGRKCKNLDDVSWTKELKESSVPNALLYKPKK